MRGSPNFAFINVPETNGMVLLLLFSFYNGMHFDCVKLNSEKS